MRPKHALAIAALTTTLVGCSAQTLPAITPAVESEALRIYATTATSSLVTDLSVAYSDGFPTFRFRSRSANYESLRDDLLNDAVPYFLSTHLPADSPLWAAPIGHDGIAMIAHPDVPVRGLTLGQIRAVYSGRIAVWDAIGGAELPVTVISRERGSGTRAEFERQVTGQTPITANARLASSSRAMLQTVAATPGSIGYISLGFLQAQSAPGVRVLAVDGSPPTLATISDETYPIRSTVFVVGREEPQGNYRAFIGWMQSPAGQRIVLRQYAPLGN